MRMYDIIEKKKRGKSLTSEEVHFFVQGVTNDSIPDYQTSAFLMAVYFNGMTDEETFMLTSEMTASGETMDLSALGSKTADKHSTGGVGDTVTLAAIPTAAAIGCTIAKMSGRGLGFTGGTIDKLEAIPGFNTTLSPNAFISQAKETGLAVIGQSGNMTPADKKLYALRDVTATVDSIPLIASSIMSKKLAAGSKNIVLDIKYGSGAFMKTKSSALELAEKMTMIGKNAGRNIAAVISPMNTPLGNAAGNALEVCEAIRVLRGGGSPNLRELSIVTAALMASLAFNKEFDECKALAEKAVSDGRALDKLKAMVKAQGGDDSYIDNPEKFKTAKTIIPFTAKSGGWIYETDCEKIGTAAMLLGAGRAVKTDSVDMSAGIVFNKKLGDKVDKGEPIAYLHTNREYSDALELLSSAVKISASEVRNEFSYEILR